MSSQAGIRPAELLVAGRARRRHAPAQARRIMAAAACVWLLTALGALAGRLSPALASGARPHPTLHGTLGELVDVLANNLRVLAAPFLLAAFHWPSHRHSRRLGDLLIAGLVAGNSIAVGLALGRYGSRLLPFVSQLPLEWTALAVAGAAWLAARAGSPARVLVRYALATLALSSAAAAVEVLLTPHVEHGLRSGREALTLSGDARPPAGSGCLPAPDFAPGRHASRSPCSLPLAALGSAWPPLAGAVWATSTTRSPQGGTIT